MSPRITHLCSSAVLSVFLCALFFSSPAAAGTLTGTVRNGTSGTIVPNQDVILIQLQGGMQSVGTFRTDAQGRFSIDHPSVGAEPVLLRAQYKGVNYHANVPPGKTSADIEVFEVTKNPAALSIESRLLAVQPNGPALIIGEEFSVHNHSEPKVSVFDEKGDFDFALPDGAEIGTVSVAGPSGMPLVTGTIEKGKGRYAVAFAFRPGESSIRVSYQIPYATNKASLKLTSPYAAKSVLVIAPPTMEIQAEGFSSRGQEQGWNVYGRSALAANTPFALNVSGTAPPPSPTDSGAAPAQASAAASNVSVVPQRLDNLKWVLIVGLVGVMSVGGFILWKRPAPQYAGTPIPAPPSPKPVTVPQAQSRATPKAVGVEQVLADAQNEAQRRLDEVKEMLVRIEMRKQAGSISAEEYSRERARAEQMLREYLS